MSFRPPINRLLFLVICSGMVGYVLTWLVHLFLKAFFRAASPFVIEGTAASICGGVLATVFGLYFGRTIAGPISRGIFWFATVLLTPIVIGAAGIAGMIFLSHVMSLCGSWIPLRANQDHDFVNVGYSLMPLIWTGVLCRIVCWYYRAKHGEPLLSFDQASSQYVTPNSPHSLDQAFRFVVRAVLLSSLVSWLVHRSVAGRLGWLWGSQSCVEGAMAVLSSGLVVAVGSLYLDHVVKNRLARESLCLVTTLVVSIAFGFAGYFGYQTAIVLERLVYRSYQNEIVVYGYYVFPPIWAGVLAWGLCWHYKATHGGASLLNFDPSVGYDDDQPK